MEKAIGIVEVATRMEGDIRDQKLHNSLGGSSLSSGVVPARFRRNQSCV
jgi:hypothetical protein